MHSCGNLDEKGNITHACGRPDDLAGAVISFNTEFLLELWRTSDRALLVDVNDMVNSRNTARRQSRSLYC